MKPIQIAYEILSESRKLREAFKSNRTEFNAIHANIYSIFECYAHGIIDWEQVKTRYKKSLLEYAALYSDNKKLHKKEKARVNEEYNRVLGEWKSPLDEYKTLSENKMTRNLVSKKNITESVAQQHSKTYFNRMLNESDLTHTARLKTWKRVMEAYPNLTANDEARVRMLTIMESPTMDTTQLVTTVVEAEPAFNPRAGHRDQLSHPENRGLEKPVVDLSPSAEAPDQIYFNKRSSSPRPKLRPDNFGDTVRRANINTAVRSAMGEAEGEDQNIDTKAFDATSLKALADLKVRYPHAKDTFDALLNAYMDVKTASIRDDDELENGIDQNTDRLERGAKRIADLENRISELTKELADDEEKLDGVRDDEKIKDLITRIEKLEREHAEMTNEDISDEKADEFHRKLDKLVHAYLGHSSDEKEEMDERKMTKSEKAKEKRLKKKYDDSGMKDSMKDHYGDGWEDVYYATIRQRAMKESEVYSDEEKRIKSAAYQKKQAEKRKQQREQRAEINKKLRDNQKERLKKSALGQAAIAIGKGLDKAADSISSQSKAMLQRSQTGMYGKKEESVESVKETTAGAIASVAKPMGNVIKRKGVAPNALDQNKLFGENKKRKK